MSIQTLSFRPVDSVPNLKVAEIEGVQTRSGANFLAFATGSNSIHVVPADDSLPGFGGATVAGPNVIEMKFDWKGWLIDLLGDIEGYAKPSLSLIVRPLRERFKRRQHAALNNRQRPRQPIERRLPHTPFTTEKPLRFDRMSGLDEEQLDELEERVSELLEKPWDKDTGRPRELTFREALVVACGYMRQNIIEDVWANIFDVDQSTISRIITFLTPLVEQATAGFSPTPEEAAEATRDTIALVDGTLWPCWSWHGESKLWSGKYKTTGHGSLIVTNLQGRITFVSEPVTGNQHDMAKLKGSDVEEILKMAGGAFGDKGFVGTDYITTPIRKPECRELLQWEHEWNNEVSSFRAPVERAVATLKTWRILFTDYRRPRKTFKSSFRAAIGLYFFKETFA